MNDSLQHRLDTAFAGILVYDRRGQRLSYPKFRRRHEALTYRFLARDVVGEVKVVTVWHGIDRGEGGPPWIFGTLTLGPDGALLGGEELLASTEAEATDHTSVLARRTAEHETIPSPDESFPLAGSHAPLRTVRCPRFPGRLGLGGSDLHRSRSGVQQPSSGRAGSRSRRG